jgi:DUF4097 and DUF4098 domain-containing protein YvlB
MLKTSNRSFALAGLLATGLLLPASAFGLEKSFTQTYPLRSGGVFSIDNVNGDVTIESWDRNEVSVEATISARTQQGLDRVEVRVKNSEERVSVETHYEESGKGWSWNNDGGDVDYVVKVPRNAELRDIELVNGGLLISDFPGRVSASTVNGKISISGLTGDLELESVNGKVDASFAQLGGNQRVEIEAVNGVIELRVPKSADFEVDASTVHGRISNDFGLEVDHGEFVGHDLRGRVGSGGARVKLENVNGAIKILAD